jgi:hypothetical protein
VTVLHPPCRPQPEADGPILSVTVSNIVREALTSSRFSAPRLVLCRGMQDWSNLGSADMPRVRAMVPRCNGEIPVIDFHCSECEWRYVMRQPEHYTISYEDAMRACSEFDDHRCEDFNPREEAV